LSAYDAAVLTSSLEMATYYEVAVNAAGKANAKLCANWVMGDLAARLNREGREIDAAPLSAGQLGGLLARVADGTISTPVARQVFDALCAGESASADEIIAIRGLRQISDSDALEKIVDQALSANAAMVEEFRAGKEKALNALVGQVMKASKGRANPQQVNELLRRKLS
ncbi:MAG TPA: Asp-tRNA(Asn)/Glu-tRNA(Gln) amidotransferase GatCAB subunit B, partial [Accumulibacter sp.]|nr:Asp-tRNA(Asn)/Glu-tRNA(Gln) amidotransferase GatCAB subunit B [Accumulibacter sp.]